MSNNRLREWLKEKSAKSSSGIGRVWQLVRLRAFDTNDASGRSKERYRRVLLSGVSSTFARGAQVATGLITVPLTLNYLGPELFGLWLTMTSMIGMFTFADLGIGSGLLGAVSEARGRKDSDMGAGAISSAFFVLLGLALALGVLFAVIYPYIPWPQVFNVSSPEGIAQSGPAVAVLATMFLVGLPLGIVSRVRLGQQEGYLDSMFTILGSVMALSGLLLVIKSEGGLPLLALMLIGLPLLAQLINGLELFGFRSPALRPRLSRVSRPGINRVMGASVFFFILQIAAAVAYQSDALILAQILGPESVTQYAVPMKLFLLIPTMLGFIFVPLWPAYSEAIARGDNGWVRATLKRSLLLAVGISVPVALALVVFGPAILRVWVGSVVQPTLALLLAAASWAIIASVGGALSAFLNGAHLLKFQSVCAVVMMVGNVGLSIVLTQRYGVSGVLWGSVIAQIVFMYIPLAFYMKGALNRVAGEVA